MDDMEGLEVALLLKEEASQLDPGPSARITMMEGLLFEKAGPGPEVHPN